MKTAIIIPARYGSTRFPGKPLAMINGKSMLSRVVDVARQASENFGNISIHVATDDERIAQHALALPVNCLMTDEACKTGSDRALQASQKLDDPPDFVLNLQGDAPFTPPQAIQSMLQAFQDDSKLEVVTPVHRLSWDDLDRLRKNKQTTPFSGTCAVLNQNKNALWFSKNIIPAMRKEDELRSDSSYSPIYQHMGLYGYRFDVLQKFCALPQGYYEQLEGLEQLRLLENDISITCVEIEIESGAMQSGIDTPEDLARAETFLLS